MAVFLGSCLSQGKLNIVSNRLHHSQTQETVTRDTFSLYHPPPKLQKPVHVTPFPLSLSNSRNRYMRHLFTCPPKPQKPLHVTPAPCPTPLPNHRNRYTWHIFPCPPKPQKPLHVSPFHCHNPLPNQRNRYTWCLSPTPPPNSNTRLSHKISTVSKERKLPAWFFVVQTTD